MRALAALAVLLSLFAGPAAAGQSGPPPAGLASAVFAGGCFWCVESDFDKVPGVKATVSGYTGGLKDNPTYRDHEGHVEAVEVTYDPKVVSYRQLTDYFLRHIDPLDDGGQFCDRGPSYRPVIFAGSAAEFEEARAAVAAATRALGRPLKTPVVDRAPFWIAEDYHQDYYLKNAARYRYYRSACGRDARVNEVWRGR